MGDDLNTTGLGEADMRRYKLGQCYKGQNLDGTVIIFKVVARWVGHVKLRILLDKDSFLSSQYPKGTTLTYRQGDIIPDCLHYKKLIAEKDVIWEML